MAQVWTLDLPPSEKLVLLALADAANDEGHCWPSATSIAKKSSQGERTVRRAIRALEAAGHLTQRQRSGTSAIYTVHPCQSGTPATVAPLPERHGTPATVAPKPSRTVKKERDKPSPKARDNPFPRPEWADRQVWADFLANRKAKRFQNTATAYARFLSDLARWQCAEWPPPRLLEHAAAHGWGGIYNPRKDFRDGRNNGMGRNQPGSGEARILAAGRAFVGRESGPPDAGRSRPDAG